MGEIGVEFDDLFDIFIQSGAILSVVVLYFNKFKKHGVQVFSYIAGKSSDRTGIEFLFKIFLGIVPIMVAGFLFRDFLDVIKSRKDLLLIIASAWVGGGIFILLSEYYFYWKNGKSKSIESSLEEIERDITITESIFIGLFQCFALIPGMSRSAATIITARFLGVQKKIAAEYSFFLAVPVLTVAGFYKLYKHRSILSAEGILPLLLLGTFVSFLLCLYVIKLFMKYLKSHDFNVFGYYRIVIGAIVIVYYYLVF